MGELRTGSLDAVDGLVAPEVVADMALPEEPPQRTDIPQTLISSIVPAVQPSSGITGVGRFLKSCWNRLENSRKSAEALERLVSLSNDASLSEAARRTVLFELGKYNYERGDLAAAKGYFARYCEGQNAVINPATPYLLSIEASAFRETSGRAIANFILRCRDFLRSELNVSDPNVVFTRNDFEAFMIELVGALSRNGGGLSTFPLFGNEKAARISYLAGAMMEFVEDNVRPCFKAMMSHLVKSANAADMEIMKKRIMDGGESPVHLQFIEFAMARPAVGEEFRRKLDLLSACVLSERDALRNIRGIAMEKLEEELSWLTRGDFRKDTSLAGLYRDLAAAYSNDGNKKKAGLFLTLADKKSRSA